MEVSINVLDIDHKKDTIRIIGKDTNNKNYVMLTKYDFYVYIIPNQNKIDYVEKELSKLNFVKEIKKERKKYFGKEYVVLKTFINYSDYDKLKEFVDKLKNDGVVLGKKEADVLIYKKFSIDKKVYPLFSYEFQTEIISKKKYHEEHRLLTIKESKEFEKSLKAIAFDIETASEKSIADPRRDPIISIAIYSDNLKKVITWRNSKFENAIVVKNEYELLKKFEEIIKTENPDVLVGYNSNNFDIYYLYERSKVLNYRFSIGVDGSNFVMTKRRDSKRFRIVGIQHVDIYETIANLFSSQMRSETLSLDEVAKEILGYGKEDLSYEDIYNLWNNGDVDKILKYNLRDAELTYKIYKYFEPILLELAKITGSTLHETASSTYGQLVENYLMKRSREFNEIIPNKPKPDELEKRKQITYKGAFVLEPKPGLYKNIAVFDFRSLYPSIIIRYNISYDTLKCEHEECKKSNSVEIETSLGKDTVWFCTKKKGVIPKVLEEIFNERVELKKKLKSLEKNSDEYRKIDSKQKALKTIINSMYGYLGFPNSRWYCLECAAAVTALGRKHIKEIVELAKKIGYTPIYGDTDSVFILVNSKEDAEKFLEEANKILPKPLELELEDFYISGIFVSRRSEEAGAKKKYALLSEKGYIKLRGFEVVRRDWSPIAKVVQENVINIVLKERSREKVISYLKDIIRKVKKRELPIEMFVLKEQLRKGIEEYKVDAPHVVAAKKYKEKGYKVGPGFIVEYVVCSGGNKISEKVKLPEECKKSEYDPEYYIERQILPAIDNILQVLGISKAHITGGQKSVLEFFRTK